MYKTQSIRSLMTDCALIAVLTPVVMFALLLGVFQINAGSVPEGTPLPWDFIGVVVGLTALAGLGQAWAHWNAGPGMKKMTPAEEKAKKAEIAACVEANMQAARDYNGALTSLKATANKVMSWEESAQMVLDDKAHTKARMEKFHTYGSTR